MTMKRKIRSFKEVQKRNVKRGKLNRGSKYKDKKRDEIENKNQIIKVLKKGQKFNEKIIEKLLIKCINEQTIKKLLTLLFFYNYFSLLLV